MHCRFAIPDFTELLPASSGVSSWFTLVHNQESDVIGQNRFKFSTKIIRVGNFLTWVDPDDLAMLRKLVHTKMP